jgi:hypothetical protein
LCSGNASKDYAMFSFSWHTDSPLYLYEPFPLSTAPSNISNEMAANRRVSCPFPSTVGGGGGATHNFLGAAAAAGAKKGKLMKIDVFFTGIRVARWGTNTMMNE